VFCLGYIVSIVWLSLRTAPRTTGLDAFTALTILSLLSSLARRGRTIIISIHQPRSDAFPFFDKLCLLSSGSVVYSGSASQILPWFGRLGHSPEESTNILDFIVDISSIDTRDDESEERSTIQVDNLVTAWKQRKNFSEQGRVRDLSSEGEVRLVDRVASDTLQTSTKPASRPRTLGQIIILTRRGLMSNWRDYGQTAGFAVQVISIAVCTGLAFYKSPETPSGIQVRCTRLFSYDMLKLKIRYTRPSKRSAIK
jgi:hypothetical protein